MNGVQVAVCEAADRSAHNRSGHHNGNHVGSGFMWDDGRLVGVTDREEFYAAVGMKIFGEAIPVGDSDRAAAWMETLNRLLAFPLKVTLRRNGVKRTIALRCIAMSWLLNPKLFEGKTLSAVARDYGVSPAALAESTGAFSREFNVRAPWQDQGAGKFKAAEPVAEETGTGEVTSEPDDDLSPTEDHEHEGAGNED